MDARRPVEIPMGLNPQGERGIDYRLTEEGLGKGTGMPMCSGEDGSIRN